MTEDVWYVELAGGKVLEAHSLQVLVGLLIRHGRNVRMVWNDENEVFFGL